MRMENSCLRHNYNGAAGPCRECNEEYRIQIAARRAEDTAGSIVGCENTAGTKVDATLAELGARYGDFTDHAKIAEALHGILVGDTPAGKFATSWGVMQPFQRQALRVIADKIARILNGDPDYVDNWHDIQGYAKLVEDRLE